MANDKSGNKTETTVTVVPEISRVNAACWDACAIPDPKHANPFVTHAFLRALEDTQCVGEHAGWIPQHLVLRDALDKICGVMPCYVKTHSRGEYVFDHAWADAFEQAGGAYYPKLQCAVPFTPVPGPRILVRPGPEAAKREQILTAAAIELIRQLKLSSLHITFAQASQCERLGKFGLLTRTDQQFHWHNNGYETFDGFLQSLSSRKRKAIRKERHTVTESGIEIEWVPGPDITSDHWDDFFEFYIDTGNRKWGDPYLNRAFFDQLSSSMSENCLLIFAKRDGRTIAGALNIIGGDCLFGRYWGAREHVPFLHFEVCYYQAIEYAIAHGLDRVEAGAQGEHKLARGYVPVTTYSAHWIANKSLRDAISRYLTSERRHVARIHDVLTDCTPYKKTNDQENTVDPGARTRSR